MLLYYEGYFSESVIQKIAEELTDKTREINKCTSVSIISEPLDEYLKLADCYREIREGFRIRRLRKQKWTSVFQKDMQYDQILLHTAQTQKSREYILRKLGPLEQYDRIHDSQLLTTLDTLIHYNGSRRQAFQKHCFFIAIPWLTVSARLRRYWVSVWMIRKRSENFLWPVS